MKLGKTIVGERESVQTESERMLYREKEKKRKTFTAVIVLMIFAVVGLGAVLVMGEVVKRGRQTDDADDGKYNPTVEIINEDGRGVVSARIRQYVGKIEQDFYEKGYRVSRVIMPAGMLRELDIYLDGREEYYKCNLDRGTAETAEDAVRMIKYLVEHEVQPEKYVDVRVEGKAYYL